MKPLLVTSGEPAGVGLDICLDLAHLNLPLVVMADKKHLTARAQALGITVKLKDYDPNTPCSATPGELTVLSLSCPQDVIAGQLNPLNASYVIQMLTTAVDCCMRGEFSAVITAPVHKAVLNDAGFHFTGHTEFFRDRCGVDDVVMMLACSLMKVALVTTHLPLCKVSNAITPPRLMKTVRILYASLQSDFGVRHPKICVAGLNPHAGESGYLGLEEIETITPTLQLLKQEGIETIGPLPADTLFSQENLECFDAFLTMYHDQGLPVIKYADFHHALNITLGLPIIRTSVDHGTALNLAGTGLANASSLIAAVNMAHSIALTRFKGNQDVSH